jgi:hypothetical protein
VGADDGTEHGAVDGVEAGRFDEADQADEPDDDRGR